MIVWVLMGCPDPSLVVRQLTLACRVFWLNASLDPRHVRDGVILCQLRVRRAVATNDELDGRHASGRAYANECLGISIQESRCASTCKYAGQHSKEKD